MVCRLPIGKYRKFKTMTSPHPSQMSLHPQILGRISVHCHYIGQDLFPMLLSEEKQTGPAETQVWSFIHGDSLLKLQIAGHTSSGSIWNLANGTEVLTGCKVKSITCQVHVIELLLAFKMLCNLITLPSFIFFSFLPKTELISYFL